MPQRVMSFSWTGDPEEPGAKFRSVKGVESSSGLETCNPGVHKADQEDLVMTPDVMRGGRFKTVYLLSLGEEALQAEPVTLFSF